VLLYLLTMPLLTTYGELSYIISFYY